MKAGSTTKAGAALRWKAVAVGVLALQLSGCAEPKSYHDSKFVYRTIDSPDGASTARLARVAGGGAAGWLFYDVYLSNNSVDGGAELVFRGYGDCNAEVAWWTSQLLVIRYAGWNCRVQSFHSFWQERDLDIGRDDTNMPRVEIMLERVSPGASDVGNRR